MPNRPTSPNQEQVGFSKVASVVKLDRVEGQKVKQDSKRYLEMSGRNVGERRINFEMHADKEE